MIFTYFLFTKDIFEFIRITKSYRLENALEAKDYKLTLISMIKEGVYQSSHHAMENILGLTQPLF